MRVIAGEKKGRRLARPKSPRLRPTTDFWKELIFSVVGDDLRNGLVLDLFSGGGGLGIEALSRGAARAVFVDNDPRSLKVLYENLSRTDLTNKSDVIRQSVSAAMKRLESSGLQFDLILADPPYSAKVAGMTLRKIAEADLLNRTGWLIIEHGVSENLSERIAGLILIKEKTRGETTVSFFRHG